MNRKFYQISFLSISLLFVLFAKKVNAQMPECINDSGFIYVHSGSSIHNWNPFAPLSGTNPVLNTIAMPAGAGGLAVGDNINNPAGPTPTFYTCVSNNYWYYDGVTWVNTGHSVGNASAVNPGAGGGVIYNLVGGTGQVYRYDGTGPGTLLTTVAGFSGGGPYDLAVDCEANFFILRCSSPAWLRKYNSAGLLVQEWDVIGAPAVGAGGGFGIVGNTLMLHNTGGLHSGPIGATSVTVSPVAGTFPSPSDFANCPIGGNPTTQYDTLYACDTVNGALFTPSGDAPYSHFVISGDANMSTVGITDVALKPHALSLVVVISNTTSPCSDGGLLRDTVLLVPPPFVNAGPDDSISGCGFYLDTVKATVTNTTPWINYYYNWTPTGSIVGSSTNNLAIVNPSSNQYYTFTVTTDANQGGCSIADSLLITLVDESVVIDFDFDIYYGCTKDSVVFQNLSQNTQKYTWTFGDASLPDTATNPKHVYLTQGSYAVWLRGENDVCRDSVSKIVNTIHTISAGFNVSADTICEGTTVNFTNNSQATFAPLKYKWYFGNGDSAVTVNAHYTYNIPGTYLVRLLISDTIGCKDSVQRWIVVDSNTALQFYTSDRSVCTGEQVAFNAVYTQNGLSKLTWDFGDHAQEFNQSHVVHAYLEPGTYFVTVSGDYRACRDTTFRDSVVVHPLPKVMLGPDTTMCPKAPPIVLSNKFTPAPGESYLWNTGETTASIIVRQPGNYGLTVRSANECAASDEIVISKDCYVDIPNSFTPNGDGVNDYFFPRGLLSGSVGGFTMQIFNRWGQLIFDTQNPQGRGWDGNFNNKPQPSGVYIYKIDVVLLNGSVESYTGNVTLLR